MPGLTIRVDPRKEPGCELTSSLDDAGISEGEERPTHDRERDCRLLVEGRGLIEAGTANIFWRLILLSRRLIASLLLFLSSHSALAGEEGAWSVLKKSYAVNDGLRLVLESHQGEVFKGCSSLTIDIGEYDAFKWSFVASITGSLKPEKRQSIESLLAKLNGLIGAAVYVAERTPLKRITDCHFYSDGAVLENDSLFLYFRLYHR